MRSGESAATRSFAASATAPESACGGAGERQLRHPQRAVMVGDGVLLELAVGDDHHGTVRRRHRDLVGAHRRFAEVRQRHRRVVPLRVVADHCGRILHAVHPLHSRRPQRRVERVAEHQVDRHAIAPRVVEGHRRVLQSDRPVRHHRERLPLDLEVAVRHGHRRLFVHAGDQFRLLVAAVVDHRLVEAAEAGAWVGADVLEAERLDRVHHEVGAGAAAGERFRLGRGWLGRRRRWRWGRGLRNGAGRRGHGGADCRRPAHELAPRIGEAGSACHRAPRVTIRTRRCNGKSRSIPAAAIQPNSATEGPASLTVNAIVNSR